MSETPPESPVLPVGGPATLDGVKLQLEIGDANDDARLIPIVTAVNDLVRSWPVAGRADGLEAWPAGIVLGANMLAARLWRRKDTPGGLEVIGDVVAYVRRSDPEIAMLLQLAEWSKPDVG